MKSSIKLEKKFSNLFVFELSGLFEERNKNKVCGQPCSLIWVLFISLVERVDAKKVNNVEAVNLTQSVNNNGTFNACTQNFNNNGTFNLTQNADNVGTFNLNQNADNVGTVNATIHENMVVGGTATFYFKSTTSIQDTVFPNRQYVFLTHIFLKF